MARPCSGVEVTLNAVVFDTETNEVIVNKKEYTYIVRPKPSAYEHDVLLARTIHYLVELLFLQRLINLYSRNDEQLRQRLKQQSWGASIELLSTNFIQEK
jgi:hypothetical protein